MNYLHCACCGKQFGLGAFELKATYESGITNWGKMRDAIFTISGAATLLRGDVANRVLCVDCNITIDVLMRALTENRRYINTIKRECSICRSDVALQYIGPKEIPCCTFDACREQICSALWDAFQAVSLSARQDLPAGSSTPDRSGQTT